MASDHRGNQLHAGKRTAQELGWRENNTGDGGYSKTITRDVLGNGSEFMHSIPSGKGGYDWMTYTHSPEDAQLGTERSWGRTVGGFPELPAGGDLGRGKTTRLGPRGNRLTVGTVSTPTRAMIAAEAMKNRIKEGRDLKTGRPKK